MTRLSTPSFGDDVLDHQGGNLIDDLLSAELQRWIGAVVGVDE